jgi:two-component system chemotaxis response regulator CheB
VIRLLLVDDSALVRKLLVRVFQAEPDFVVEVARNGVEALEKLPIFKPDVVTLDIHMPEMDGLACLDRIMVEGPCPVVMVSSLTKEGAEATLEALRLGAVDFVAKPGGAVSLRIDELAEELVQKVRAAAGARVRLVSRLRERVRHRIGAASVRPPPQRESDDEAVEVRRAGSEQGLVVVGTSTGGPPALEALLAPLPASFPWPLVIAQHMPRSFTGALAKRLDGICEISVREVGQTTVLEPGVAYIGRGDADVIVSRRTGALVAMAAPAQPGYPWHPSTERLVRTAMDALPANLIVGVLMTGMGDDGAAAMTELRSRGGRTIAEAESTAVVWGMPGELVKLGGASIVAPLDRIAGRLRKLVA